MHYALTFKSGEQRLYYDGNIVASNKAVGTLLINNLPIHIGKGVQRNYNLDGFIDDIRLYNRTLSALEIQALHKQLQFILNKDK